MVVSRDNINIKGLWYLCTINKYCHNNTIISTSIEFILLFDLHLADFFTAFIILFVKRREDLLLSFNRLGDLVKISMF